MKLRTRINNMFVPDLTKRKHDQALLKMYIKPKLPAWEQEKLKLRIQGRLKHHNYACYLPRPPYPDAWKVKPRVRYKLTTMTIPGKWFPNAKQVVWR